jgi:hypothetical protein
MLNFQPKEVKGMKYEKMTNYGEGKFRRITGIRRRTFAKMVEIISSAEKELRSRGGPKPKLSVEDMLLATLEYWREYRTYAHIAVGFELSESQIFRIVKRVENVLIKNGTFSLPGKKRLLDPDADYDIVLLDATESPIERPKKDNKTGTPGKRNAIP